MQHPATRIRKVREQNIVAGLNKRVGHGYKPFALRTPFLVVFLVVFGVCIAMIERLLANTTQVYSPKIKRADTCSSASTYSSELADVEKDYSAICAKFSTTFAPSSTRLPVSLQTAFVQWSASYVSVTGAKANIRSQSRSCYLATARSPTADSVAFITAGCSSSPNPDPTNPCPSVGTLTMINGSLSSGYIPGNCPVATQSLLAVATSSTPSGSTKATSSAATSKQSSAKTTSQTSYTNSSTTSKLPTITLSASTQSTSKTSTSKTTQSVDSNHNGSGNNSGGSTISPDSNDNTPTSTSPTGAGDSSSDPHNNSDTDDFTTTTEYTTTAETTDAAGSLTTLTAVVEQTIVLDSTPTSETVIVSATATSDGNGSQSSGSGKGQVQFRLASDEVMVDRHFTDISFFGALFFAPILAVIIKALYEIVHTSLKLVEPFHQLDKQAGARASDSILTQYLSSTISSYAIRAIKTASFLPLWSTIMFCFVAFAAPIASAAMSVRPRSVCLVDGEDAPCDPAWVINLIAVRFVETMIAACILLILLIIFFTWDYTLPLPGNPSSIASIASLMNHEPLLNDLVQIDPDASDLEYSLVLDRYRFWLNDHIDPATKQARMGIIGHKESNYEELLYPQTGQQLQLRRSNDGSINYRPLSTPSHRHSESVPSQYNLASSPPLAPTPSTIQRLTANRKLKSQLVDGFCLVVIIALLAVLLAWYLDNASSHFNNFFDSQSVLPKIVLVGLAALADALLKHIERTVRITEPFRRLSLRHARPETTILLPLSGTCWTNLPRCIYYLFRYSRDGNMSWQTFVTIVACMGDLNIITVAGVLFSDAQTARSLLPCMYISIIFSAFMLAVVLITMFWWRRVEVIRDMPRHPSNIANVMSYLCGSTMTREWMGAADAQTGTLFEHMCEAQRRELVLSSGRRFRFGQFISPVDERVRWSIDFEGDEVFVVSEEKHFATSDKQHEVTVSVESVSLRAQQRQQVMEWEALRERESQRQREQEREAQAEADQQRDRDRERERERQMEVDRQTHVETERQRKIARQIELVRQRELEMQYYADERIKGRLEVPA